MAIPFADDLAAILNVNEFAVAVTYTPSGGSATTINVIFDNETVPVDTGGFVPVHEEQPRVTCRTQDVLNIGEGDAFTISGVSYTVRVWTHDGVGVTTVHLEKVENDDGLAPTAIEEDYGAITDPVTQQVELN